MIKKKGLLKLVFTIWLALLFMVVFIASSSATPAATPMKEVVIGFNYGFTGPTPMVKESLRHRAGAELFLEDLEARGGFTVAGEKYTFKYISYDTTNTVSGSVNVYKRFISMGVKYLGYDIYTPAAMAIQPELTKHKIVSFSTGHGAGVLSPGGTYAFRVQNCPRQTTSAIYQWIANNLPQVTKIGGLFCAGDVADSISADIQAICKETRLEYVGTQTVTREQTDYTSEITKLIALGTDLIDVTTANSPGPEKNGRDLGWKGIFVNQIIHAEDLFKVLSTQDLEGIINPVPTPDSPLCSPKIREFCKRLEAKGQYPSVFGIAGYETPSILAQAMEKANSIDTTKVRDALETAEFQTLEGACRFGGKEKFGIGHQLYYPFYIAVIRNGKLVVIGRVKP
jgi:branched-chain amino acid transport system substrate-binding protein